MCSWMIHTWVFLENSLEKSDVENNILVAESKVCVKGKFWDIKLNHFFFLNILIN